MPDSNATIIFAQALALHQQGRIADARVLYERILVLDANHTGALSNLGIIYSQSGQPEFAIRLIGHSLALQPSQPVALLNLGIAQQHTNRLGEALMSYEKAIALRTDYAEAHHNRGYTLQLLNRPEEALASYERSLALRPDIALSHSNRGIVLQMLGRSVEALASFDRSLSLRPDYAEAYYNRGNALQDMGLQVEALASFDQALALRPDLVEAHNNRANVLKNIGRLDEALAGCERALALRPDSAEAHNTRGIIHQSLDRHDEALASYDRAVALRPDYAEAHYNRGNVLQAMKRLDDALASFEVAHTLKPDHPYLVGTWLYCKMHCCDWSGLDAAFSVVRDATDRRQKVAAPFAALAMPLSPTQLQTCARVCVADRFAPATASGHKGETYAHNRIRLGYFSGDFGDHPVSHLIAGLIETHDHNRFEVIGFSSGPPVADDWRQRLEKAFDRFYDVSALPDAELAELVRRTEIDIAVDLSGFTGKSRLGTFARRPAPVQVNYLGYAGTVGAAYMDYVIADRIVIPAGQEQFYDEKIVFLPHTFQVNDSAKVVSSRRFSRAELALPEDAFVFCSFNNHYKITPDVFDIWIRLLHAIDSSVLWLSGASAVTAANLHREAAQRGIPAERLIFATRMERLADHLARLREANLFLDTFWFNAHTTASDALWAGVPVLTCPGDTFASRVGASLLNAIGLPELIAGSRTVYETLALELATQSERLSTIREKLASNRKYYPLFNTRQFATHIESAYVKMYERLQSGLPPDHIVVTP